MDRELVVPFVNKLIRAKASADSFADREAEKEKAVNALRSELAPELKRELREGFDFTLRDDKGKKKQSSFDDRGNPTTVERKRQRPVLAGCVRPLT